MRQIWLVRAKRIACGSGGAASSSEHLRERERQCHGPAFRRKRPKRLRESSKNWDRPSGCHGPAFDASFADLPS